LSAKDTVALVKIFTQSAADLLDEWFESEQVKVTLATDGVIGANGGPRSPGTAYILLHHCMGGVAGHRGLWGFVRGGMGAVSEAIAGAARASGATIRTNAAWRRCWCAADARRAWCSKAARRSSGTVASNLDPKITFLRWSRRSIWTANSSPPSGDSASRAQAAKSIWR
jgi:phytoene dehydrogenase-like protein